MDFVRMNNDHIEEAVKLGLLQYDEQWSKLQILPKKDYYNKYVKNITYMVKNNLGMVALDGKNLVGFMTGYGPIDDFFGKETGIFVPNEGHGATQENRQKIYNKLYQSIAKRWVDEGVTSHGIAVFNNDLKTKEPFFVNGFGMRCQDGLTSLEENKLTFNHEHIKQELENKHIVIEEIDHDSLDQVIDLKNELVKHLQESPIFLPNGKYSLERFVEQSIKRMSRFMVIKDHDKVIGYIEVQDSGENIISCDPSVKNICGAYMYPKYRGSGLFTSLLGFVFDKMREDGVKLLGVDYETLNPEAYGFWNKNFTPYITSLTRRIDERITVAHT